MATRVSECKACGNQFSGATRYCPPCDDNVREMVDEYNGQPGERFPGNEKNS